MKFKILCLLAGTFAAHSMCLAGFTVWELVNDRGRPNYVVEAEVTDPQNYVTESGMYFISRYMEQVEFFAGSESLPWLLADKTKGSFGLNMWDSNLYYVNSHGRRFDMDRMAPDKWGLWDFNARVPALQTVDQTSLVKTFLKSVFLVNQTEKEDEEDHLHCF